MSEQRSPKEWDATAYHKVSTPQQAWGRRVLARLDLKGNERVADAGCGSGHLTADLCERLPSGHVVAMDRSANMLVEARRTLARFGDRVSYLEVDLTDLELSPRVDALFSTATLHWIHDHDKLWASLRRAMNPGGQLVVQFGGPHNLTRVHGHTQRVLKEPKFAERMVDFVEPYYFPAIDLTEARVKAAGFTNVRAWPEDAPTPFTSETEAKQFLSSVILRAHLARLNDAALGEELLRRVIDGLADDERKAPSHPGALLVLDYTRANVDARA